MRYSIVNAALIAATAVVLATPSFATESAASSSAAPAKSATTTNGTKAKAKAKAPTPAKLVDINSASKAELKKLSGIDDAQADRIIAGRPYGSKADLVTRGILPAGTYEAIKKQVMAKPKAV